MKVVVLYRPDSEYSRITEEFVRDYQAQHETRLELLSLDTRDGIALATLYDVMQYPAILIVQNDGFLTKLWQGTQFPRMEEVASYTSG